MCGLEFPDLETAIWQRFRGRGLRVFGANVNDGRAGDTDEVVRRFVEQTGVTFPIVRDTVGHQLFLPVAEGVGAAPFPVHVLIDANGRLVSVRGYHDPQRLASEIESLVR